MTQVTIEFEELQPVIEGCIVEGMMLYGKALLESSDSSEPHEFYVSEVTLDGSNGGFVLSASGAGVMGFPSEFRKKLFRACVDAIENDRTDLGKRAQIEFSSAVDGESEPDTDAGYDDFRGEVPALRSAVRPGFDAKIGGPA